ncbi:MAG TPA: tetratricopeptide repeat protein [Thermoguttaceae bacterium]|nr:tetratricopeptide repeat protein [Thermoguttaceae bacterium]
MGIPTATARAQGVAPGSTSPASVGTAWELAIQRAQEHIRHGLNLASRRAVYSAQAEFLQALRLIAQELDVASGNQEHEAALTAGWRALETLEYVKPPAAGFGGRSDHARAFEAMQRQLGFAEQRLAFSGRHEPTASMALYALGRSFIAIAEELPEEGPLCGPKALVTYRAAIAVDPRNCLAVNELAMLLARCGQLDEAACVLADGVALSPQPQLWHNLAVIHEKMGRPAWAQEDRRRRDVLLAAERERQGGNASATALGAVRWVEPTEFARCSGSDDLGPSSASKAAATAQHETAATEPASAAKTRPFVPKWMADLMDADSGRGETTGESTIR